MAKLDANTPSPHNKDDDALQGVVSFEALVRKLYEWDMQERELILIKLGQIEDRWGLERTKQPSHRTRRKTK